MKAFIVAISLLSLVACTSLRPIVATPEDLRETIARGQLIKPGESIALRTKDGRNHAMTIVRVADGAVVGERESVAISDVVALQTRQPSFGKTFALSIAVALVVIFAAGYYALSSTPGPLFTL